ncbi:S41 family peptidase [Undibacterium cyanobacteriorum]|uniref:Tricorn protease homolog n=1 Tax=Undibacterium cyanobacteriorum TaxID=3073561 RepID=A0ABY9RLL5_9BURK|nr:S41 family peptidase [Undibacterium sp. 20NA77.5]WMW81763.1 S41 family peptidase [Undibacterium sp. 20NA77.5]
MKKRALFILTSLSCAIAAAYAPLANAADNNAYVRFPSIRADQVVFTAEGDLWKVGLNGGAAQRLTTHAGAETNAAISPDGKWIAFSATYEGAQEAYVMPFNGGLPKRISFENAAVTVLGWSVQGEVIVTMQNQTGPIAQNVIAAIQPQSLHKTIFPIVDANEAALDDSGKTLYFTRLGVHTRNDNVKQYRGGALAQLWKFDLSSKAEAVNLFAKEKSNNRRPMLWKNRLYFLSDRDGAYNLYAANLDGGEPKAITRHRDWDVRNPQLGDGKIAYQLGANLHVIDLSSSADKIVSAELISDFDQSRQRYIKNPLDFLTNVQVAAKEERLVFTARGQMAIAGISPQRRVDINLPNAARAREAVFSHDDKYVYAFVDSTGENEIWRFKTDGSGKGEQLTNDGKTHRLNIYPSPDGKFLAHTDKRGCLFLLDLNTKSNVVIDDAGKQGYGNHGDVVWSADGKTLAITRANSSQGREQIGLYDLDSKQLHFVTSDRYESDSPAFSPDGRWLYFLSNRNFQPGVGAPWGDRNMGTYFDKRAGIFALALQAGNRFPFKPDDELSRAESKQENKSESKADNKAEAKASDTSAQNAAEKKSESSKKASNAIQYEGIAQRLYEVPIASGNYRQLEVDDKRLYFLDRDPIERGRNNLKTLAIAKNSPQAEVFTANVRGYGLSKDKKRIYFNTGTGTSGDFYITDSGAKAPGDLSKAKIKVEDWTFNSNPRDEWKQMFMDAWRMHRDFLYDTKMRGVDWDKMRDKYAPLVERVTDRAELNDVLALMVSEVSSLHSQIRPGDVRRAPADGTPAGLGAVLSKVQDGYRIDHIYRSEPDLPSQRGPLDNPDLDIKTGDVITAINGKSVLEVRDISDLLLNQADKQVLMQVKRANQAAKPVLVSPITMQKQANLRYSDWEQNLSQRVDKASDGKIGYLHLRAMGPADVASFARDFYANYDRDGLIIDVRRNNGGNIDSWIIEKLLRKAWAFWSSEGNRPYTNMQQTFRGHLVVLIDELTYSDGETFAAGVKALNLAPLVGKRTSGAGVWLSDRNTLADNGMVRAAENAQFDVKDGRWLVEGVGVAPDIEVDNPPHASFKGEDKQLEAAINYLQKKLKEQPIKPLAPQAIPPLK